MIRRQCAVLLGSAVPPHLEISDQLLAMPQIGAYFGHHSKTAARAH
jgi:hypothetical protein